MPQQLHIIGKACRLLTDTVLTHLLQVRGKDFRHEKTKKKRGTYKGGLIETGAVHSFKFESDED